jgi:hypothetical protein
MLKSLRQLRGGTDTIRWARTRNASPRRRTAIALDGLPDRWEVQPVGPDPWRSHDRDHDGGWRKGKASPPSFSRKPRSPEPDPGLAFHDRTLRLLWR